jgi:desulfoferrodoxin (superoxide reductase-like protein)
VERGLGCPDISLLGELSRILDVNVDKLLSGSLGCNFADSGNIQKIRFYVCPSCGSTLTATGGAEVSCCGRKLKPLTPRPVDDMHRPRVEEVENEYYITFAHEMNKTHFIRFAALVSSDRVLFVKLYPEQDAAFRCPNLTTAGALYICCSRHGLWIDRN